MAGTIETWVNPEIAERTKDSVAVIRAIVDSSKRNDEGEPPGVVTQASRYARYRASLAAENIYRRWTLGRRR